MELKRRYGITLKSEPAPTKVKPASETIEVINTTPHTVIATEPSRQVHAPVEQHVPAVTSITEPKRAFPLLAGVLLVLGAVTVLLWYLLHAR